MTPSASIESIAPYILPFSALENAEISTISATSGRYSGSRIKAPKTAVSSSGDSGSVKPSGRLQVIVFSHCFMVCVFCGFVEFGFTVHPIPGGGSPVLYRISTGSPAVGRVVVVKTFRIRIGSPDSQKIIFDCFGRGARLARAFFTPDREFFYFIIYILIYILILIFEGIGCFWLFFGCFPVESWLFFGCFCAFRFPIGAPPLHPFR